RRCGAWLVNAPSIEHAARENFVSRITCRRHCVPGTRAMILPLQMLYFEDLAVGLAETLTKTIDSSDVVGFAEVTGDRNPIHLSEHFAAKTPFGTRIAHGLYTASLISAVL